MAVLMVEEIDSRANSRIVQVSFGMSIRFRNSGSLSRVRQSLMVGSLANSKVLTNDNFAHSLH